jgi:hypothetical protein
VSCKFSACFGFKRQHAAKAGVAKLSNERQRLPRHAAPSFVTRNIFASERNARDIIPASSSANHCVWDSRVQLKVEDVKEI